MERGREKKDHVLGREIVPKKTDEEKARQK